ncbi:MAG: glycosyltransferase [Candidatus Latescibacterota bacterium]|nr:glycosyltransferase [Candidatus Latescibacterota bacterium]
MSNLNLLVITTGFPRFNGDLFGTFIYEQVTALCDRKVIVQVVAPHEAGLSRVEKMGEINIRRFRYLWPEKWQCVAYGGGIPTNIRTSWCTRIQLPVFILGFVWGVFKQRYGIQVVHCHWTVSGLIASWVFGKQVPIVLSVRGSDIKLFNNFFSRFFNRHIISRMECVVAVSDDLANSLKKIGVQKERIKVIPNGVSARFQPGDRALSRREQNLPEEGFIILFVGLFVHVKGLDVLVDALSNWQKDIDWKCVLVGEGPEKNNIVDQIQNYGLERQFVFAGSQAVDRIPVWMQAADLLVLPSRSEGRPNVCIEAQACGIPVVATRVGGTAEVVIDGKTGVLVDPEDSDALEAALTSMKYDENLRLKMGQTARTHVKEQGLTWEENASKLHELYKKLLVRKA